MIEIDDEITAFLRARASGAAPEPDLDGLLAGRTSLIEEPREIRSLEFIDEGTDAEIQRPNDGRHRRASTTLVRVAAVVLGVAAVAGIVWLGASRVDAPADAPITVPPATIQLPSATSFADRALAPLSGEVWAISVANAGAEIDHRRFAVTEDGVRLSPANPSPLPTPDADQTYVDVYAGVSHLYTATCCDAEGSGSVRSTTDPASSTGTVLGRGARLDNLEASAPLAYVDAPTGTVTFGDVVIDAPGAVDVAMLAGGDAAVLVDGDDPRLDLYSAIGGEVSTKADRRIDVPDGTCAVVTVDASAVAFSGRVGSDGQCLADRGAVLDLSSGQTITEFALPATMQNVDSDHSTLMVATSVGGDLWIGTLDPRPAWYQLERGDYLTADVWSATP